MVISAGFFLKLTGMESDTPLVHRNTNVALLKRTPTVRERGGQGGREGGRQGGREGDREGGRGREGRREGGRGEGGKKGRKEGKKEKKGGRREIDTYSNTALKAGKGGGWGEGMPPMVLIMSSHVPHAGSQYSQMGST